MIDVVQKQVQRRDSLRDTILQEPPVAARQDAGNDVEGENTVDRVAVAVDREGDAEVVEFALGIPGPAPSAYPG